MKALAMGPEEPRSRTVIGAVMLCLAVQFLAPGAFAQSKPAVELEGAINKEQVDGDLKTAIAAYQKIAADTSASRDIRSKALLHLAGCYEKLGQQAQKVYEQIVRDFADQPAAAPARARLARYSTQVSGLKELKPLRLTANTPELPVQAAATSPEGKFIGYSDPLGIHVRSMTTGETRLLTGTNGHVLVKWMPDGNRLETQVPDSAGAAITMLVSLQGGGPMPAPITHSFMDSPDRVHRATVSADNRQLSIEDATGANSRELWKAVGKRALDQFQWSPNSKQMAILTSEGNTRWNPSVSTLELIDIATGQEHLLVPVDKNLSIGSIAWTSRNRIIFTVDEDLGVIRYNSNLWEVRVSGGGALVAGGLRRLTSWTDFPIRSGSLITDGKRLAFIRSFQQRDVYVAPLEAGGTRIGTPRRFTLDLGDDYPTGWTLDSKSIIFTSSRNGPQAIFRQDLDKQTANQIVVMPGNQLLARLTPDGNSVLFRSYDPVKQAGQLMRVPLGGGTPEAVPNTDEVGASYRCAPAGVCLIAQKQEQGFVVSELDIATGKGREIYRDSQAVHPNLSPDGKWIADTAGSGSQIKIVLRSYATGAIVREIPVRGVANLWSLHYASDGKGFFAGDISLAEVRELYIDLCGKTSLLWRQPGPGFPIWGVPSPDGKYLALVLVTDDSNVYTVENF